MTILKLNNGKKPATKTESQPTGSGYSGKTGKEVVATTK